MCTGCLIVILTQKTSNIWCNFNKYFHIVDTQDNEMEATFMNTNRECHVVMCPTEVL